MELGISVSNTREAARMPLPVFQLQTGQTARILIPENKVVGVLRHWTKPLGAVQCLGDYDTVMEHKADKKACPLCQLATPGRDQWVGLASRYFGVVIARYVLDATGKVMNPMNFTLEWWRFGEDKFTILAQRGAELEDGKTLADFDLKITCTEAQYQKLDIAMMQKCLVRSHEGGKYLEPLIAMYNEQKPSLAVLQADLANKYDKDTLFRAFSANPQAPLPVAGAAGAFDDDDEPFGVGYAPAVTAQINEDELADIMGNPAE